MEALVHKRRQSTPDDYKLYIAGEFVPTKERFPAIDPYTCETWTSVPKADDGDLERAVTAARKAFDKGPWPRMTGHQRAEFIRRFADIIRDRAEILAEAEARDNGKLFKDMHSKWKTVADIFHFYAGAATQLGGTTAPSERLDYFIYTRREPVGVVAAIIPWNSPGLLLAFKLAPGLAAGCTFVVKPSEHASVTSLMLAEYFHEVGFPEGVMNVVTGDGAIGAALVKHRGVDKVAFTGSSATGKAIFRSAAENMTRLALELGGKSPNIVFEDADLDKALDGAAMAIFGSTGESCMAGSRLLLHESFHDAFVEKLAERAKAISLGDPMNADTEMGPLANEPQFKKVLGYFDVARSEGARVVSGGKARPDLGPLFVEPTVLAGISNDMRIAREEVFGPVVSIIKFRDEEEAIEIANATRFGLAGAVWTEDFRRGHRVANALRTGVVWINGYRALSYATPFGGFKESGMGRENGLDGLLAYTETKSVYVRVAD